MLRVTAANVVLEVGFNFAFVAAERTLELRFFVAALEFPMAP